MIRTAAVSVCLALAACQAPPSRFEFTELHMGMAVHVALHAADEVTARRAARAAFDRIAELEDVFSDYRAESEVRQLALRAMSEPGAWVSAGEHLLRVLSAAREAAEATDGAFDPTLGPLVALWRESRDLGRLPDPRALDAARAGTGWEHIAVDTLAGRVRLAVPGMRLDLGGIAKGYILGEALAALGRSGAPSAMLQAGGDLVLGAAPPGRPGWEIQIGEQVEVLSRTAVATSGTGEQFAEIGGVRYAHLIDPRTGLGLRVSRRATVVGPDPMLADALATALVVLGSTETGRLRALFPAYRFIVTR